MHIDTTYNVFTDSNGKDPDYASATLRSYHKFLWSKPLPCGEVFELDDTVKWVYLHHKSKLGEFFMASDAITHSYRQHYRKKRITQQVPKDVDEVYSISSVVGAYTIFPGNRIDGKNTINQARGVTGLIDDRFDLTLECIRRFYIDESSPLYDTLLRYKNFFDLFESFMGYVDFFLLNDLVDENQNVRFYLPFDNFKSAPKFNTVEDYLTYKKCIIDFVTSRNRRMEDYANKVNSQKENHYQSTVVT